MALAVTERWSQSLRPSVGRETVTGVVRCDHENNVLIKKFFVKKGIILLPF
jgi:hypothetical protein